MRTTRRSPVLFSSFVCGVRTPVVTFPSREDIHMKSGLGEMVRFAIIVLSLFMTMDLVGGNVIGIDLATDSLKVSIVQPGTPLEIGLLLLLTCKSWLIIDFRQLRTFNQSERLPLALLSTKENVSLVLMVMP